MFLSKCDQISSTCRDHAHSKYVSIVQPTGGKGKAAEIDICTKDK